MSLPLLHETRTELRRLSVAGGALASDDFRLKKLIPQLLESGKTAPVFARLGALLEKATTSDSQALLDAGVLVNAILYTQGSSGCSGEMHLPTAAPHPLSSSHSYRLLNPLLVALTTKGGGRYETIEQGIESGSIYDLRLLGALVNALEDSYAAIPPRIADVLKQIGSPCIPLLLERFDPKQKGNASALRLEVLGSLLKEKGADLYRQAYDEGAPAVRIKAIEMMGNNPEFESLLIEAAKNRKEDVRRAAFLGLSSISSSTEGRDILLKALESDAYQDVVDAISHKGSPLLLQDLLEYAQALLKTVQESLSASSGKYDPKEGSPLDRLFTALGGLVSAHHQGAGTYECALQILELTVQRPQVQIARRLDAFWGNYYDDLREEMQACLSMAAKAVASFKTMDALCVLEQAIETNTSSKSLAYTTARLAFDLRTPKQFFDRYALLLDKGSKTPHGEALLNLFSRQIGTDRFVTFDPRWTSVFISLDELRLIVPLARPGDATVESYLRQKLETTLRLAKENNSVHSHALLSTMRQCVEGLHQMNVTDFNADLCHWIEENYLLGFIFAPQEKRFRHQYQIPYQNYVIDALALMPALATPMLERVHQQVQEKLPDSIHLVDRLMYDFNRSR